MSLPHAKPVPAPLLVLTGIVSVQFGGALAATLVPRLGAAGTVTLRLLIATAILVGFLRPRFRDLTPDARVSVLLFGAVLAAMNLSFYASLAYLPIGVAVTIEFIGPLGLAAVLSRRVLDGVAVLAAAAGVAMISGAFTSAIDLSPRGVALALLAGACWAGYILASGRTGALVPGLDGLAWAMVTASLLVAPFGLASVPEWTWPIVATGAAIAVLSSVVPYSLELLALRRLHPRVFGILLSLEPAVAALAGLAILQQRLAGSQLLGMTLVIAASAVVLGLRPVPAEQS